MERAIIGFDQDELGEWRAILACGHRQHVRHDPPMVSRPWVLTEEGRSQFRGATLDCKACDEGEPVSDAMVSPDVLEAIYAQLHANLYHFVLSRVSDPGTAEAILRDIYPKLHSQAGDLHGSDRPASRLYQVVRNALIDHYRHARPRVELPAQLALSEADDSDGTAELALAVRTFLACLPGKVRQALIMAEYQGLRVWEIAERLDISPAEAESRVRGGRAMLGEALMDWCHWVVEREM